MRIAIIGQGNVATHLAKAFSEGGAETIQINSRKVGKADFICDIVLLCVSDDAIVEVAKNAFDAGLISDKTVLAHTAGSVSADVLAPFATHYGVLYPLQTFSKDVALNYKDIPFFIEGESAATEQVLGNAASMVSQTVKKADSELRGKLHISAVFACNFTNHLWTIADELLQEEDLDISVLVPLLKETLSKIQVKSPRSCQTGPAIRRDMKVIENHLAALENHPDYQNIYKTMTKSILEQ